MVILLIYNDYSKTDQWNNMILNLSIWVECKYKVSN